MDIVKGVVSLIVILTVLVVVHEWGHFILAKLFKMRVEEFNVFFGKVLVRLGVRSGTTYNLRALPLGGFVKIAGMEADDISGGRPILEALRTPPAGDSSEMTRIIQQLDADTMSGIDASKITPPVQELIRGAIGADGKLTDEGLTDLMAKQHSPQLNTDEHKLIDLALQAHTRATDPALYSQKPIWQRSLVIFAGPFVNLVFGYLLFCLMGMTVGLPSPTKPYTNQIQLAQETDAPARKAGLHTGDRIAAINGVPTPDGQKMVDIIHKSIGIPLDLAVNREGRTVHMVVVPKADEQKARGKDGKITTERVGRIGIVLTRAYERTGPWESIVAGSYVTYGYLSTLLGALTGGHARDLVGGPILMGQVTIAEQRMGISHLLELAASFSLSLGIMNLLPIPILDGGHLLLLSIEKIRRRKLSPREIYKAQMVGLGLLALLVTFVMYNDVVRTIAGRSIQ